MGKRRKSREIALQGLYMADSGSQCVEDICSYEWLEKQPDRETLNFSSRIIVGTLDNIESIDKIIKKYAKNWKFDRIEKIDLTILRIAIFELTACADIPPAVSINEAIEIGKQYGGEHSGQFINGILDSVKKQELGIE